MGRIGKLRLIPFFLSDQSMMNNLILFSGIVCLFTALVHIFAGQANPIRPLLTSELDDGVKATLLAVWHMVSAVLLLSGFFLAYVGFFPTQSLISTVASISWLYIIFSGIFILVGAYFFKEQTFIKCPQWLLLMPVGILGLVGSI